MGFSVSASTLIIFLGVMVAMSAVYGAWNFSQNELETANDQAQTDRLEKFQTSIEIVDTTYNVSGNKYTINVSNNGSVGLEANDTTIILDGDVVDATIKVKNHQGSEHWLPGEFLIANVSISSEPSRTKVVAENGVSDVE